MGNVQSVMSNKRWIFCFMAAFPLCTAVNAQQATTAVPRLVNFAGRAADAQGKAVSGVAGVTFSIYKGQYDGAPLWMETQNVTADNEGNYTAQLGATKPGGLPLDLFGTGESRWLGVSVNGGAEQPRVLLLSVPYALKAADAETIGGLPPSAFMLAAHADSSGSTATPDAVSPETSPLALGGSGTTDYVPLWTPNGNTLGNSVLFQSGTGSTGKIGVNTTTPATALDVAGAGTIRGTLTLPATGKATAGTGKTSQPLSLTASAFNSTTQTAVSQNFRWQAEPTQNNTAGASGSLNLLYGSGSGSPAETGLAVASNGRITFAPGQTFPGTGTGTVTSVGISAPASDFTVSGSPVTGSGTLGLSWSVEPTNSNTANAIVKRDGSGNFSAAGITATNVIASNVASAVSGTMTASNSTGAVTGVATATGTGPTFGVLGSTSTTTGAGVLGETINGGYGVSGTAVGTSGQGVRGEAFGTQVSNGVGPDGVDGFTHADGASGVGGFNTANGYGVFGQGGSYGVYGTSFGSNGVGVYGTGTNAFWADGNVHQATESGGWVKAMVYYSGLNSGAVISCFNSALSGAAATTPPCGISGGKFGTGDYNIDFGFPVNDRFFALAETYLTQVQGLVCTTTNGGSCPNLAYIGPNSVEVTFFLGANYFDQKFYLIVY